MNALLRQLSATGRNAAYRKDWPTLDACAREFLKRDVNDPEGHFLAGLVAKAAQQADRATTEFSTALGLDGNRYDAALELANQHCLAQRHGDAFALAERYESLLDNSPVYLNMAGNVYSGIGMPDRAMPLYRRADQLQPGVDLFLANIANCGVFLGDIDESRRIFRDLLTRHPGHQRYHYQLSRLDTATDTGHIDEMLAVLAGNGLSPDRNIFMHYAIGKEYEDLERWDDAFSHYRQAGDAVSSVADYDITQDIELIDRIISTCSADWLGQEPVAASGGTGDHVPIFVVGLPRTGTTLTERIIASHSEVRGVGESQYMQMVIRRESGINSRQKITPAMIHAAAGLDTGIIRDGYLGMLDYKLGDQRYFVDKLPFNLLYLGFIAREFPAARLVLVNRNPMDSCFAMYKQVFTWAYKFSYSLEGLGTFFPAYRRLVDHWRSVLGDRLIELDYEQLVADQETETRRLLEQLGLPFEPECLAFENNRSATLTASSVQVREKVHSRSVGRWQHFADALEPLRIMLADAGIDVESGSPGDSATGKGTE